MLRGLFRDRDGGTEYYTAAFTAYYAYLDSLLCTRSCHSWLCQLQLLPRSGLTPGAYPRRRGAGAGHRRRAGREEQARDDLRGAYAAAGQAQRGLG